MNPADSGCTSKPAPSHPFPIYPQYIDHLFAGSILGQKSDIADGSLRKQGDEFRTFNNLVGDYYVAPRFLEAIGLHLAKNLLVSEMDRVRVPLILAIWGGKGQGKSFQVRIQTFMGLYHTYRMPFFSLPSS